MHICIDSHNWLIITKLGWGLGIETRFRWILEICDVSRRFYGLKVTYDLSPFRYNRLTPSKYAAKKFLRHLTLSRLSPPQLMVTIAHIHDIYKSPLAVLRQLHYM
jgi:hypothetical protein